FLDILPRPLNIHWAAALNESPTLQFSYSTQVRGGEYLDRLLGEQLDVAVELNWGAGWVEPPSARFIVIDRDDDTSKPDHIYRFICVGVDDYMAGVVVTGTSLYDENGRREFRDATPGEILDSFHAFGADNGMLNFLTNDFTPSATS